MRNRKPIVFILISVVFAVLLELAYIYTLPQFCVKNIKNGVSVLNENYTFQQTGYEQSGNNYKAITGDPQIYIRGYEEEITYIQISFNECSANPVIDIYYPDETGALSEAQKSLAIYNRGTKTAVAEIPTDEYLFMRIDINADFDLKDIQFSSQSPTGTLLPNKFNILRCFAFFIGICICEFIVYRLSKKIIIKKENILSIKWLVQPENLFIIVALLCGVTLCFSMPKSTQISWDDEAHYQRALQLSYLGAPRVTEADVELFYRAPVVDVFQFQQQEEYLNVLYEQGALSDTIPRPVSITNFWSYLPMAIGLFIGRILCLSFTNIWVVGRITNLLFYVTVVYIAIKRTPVCKVLMAIIALFPTNIFMASNFSYDPWIISLTMLGFALFLEQYMDNEKRFSIKNVIIMLLIFMLAFLPKQIYFPILVFLLVMPKKKFETLQDWKMYVALVFGTMAVLAISFVMPYLGGAQSMSDFRGGAGVNAISQLKFIFSNPIEYAKILFTHIRNYLSLQNTGNYTSFLSYLGAGKHSLLCIALVVYVVANDCVHSDKDANSIRINRLLMIVMFFITICVISSALYVKFTPVALPVINGCQARYITPLLFPFLVFVFWRRGELKLNYTAYTLSSFAISAFILISAIWETCLSKCV